MNALIDISVSLQKDLPSWPGSSGIRLTRVMRLEEGDVANVSQIETDVHVGTHVDAPLHFLVNGDPVDRLPLEVLIGPAFVAGVQEVDVVSAQTLEHLQLPAGTSRLLLKTRNRQWWTQPFRTDYVALTSDAAKWIVRRGIRLVGIDYLSIQRYVDGPETHKMLLRAGVVIVEGLNLADVVPGSYELICLPLKLAGAEGAPARAVLRPLASPHQ